MHGVDTAWRQLTWVFHDDVAGGLATHRFSGADISPGNNTYHQSDQIGCVPSRKIFRANQNAKRLHGSTNHVERAVRINEQSQFLLLTLETDGDLACWRSTH